MNSRMGRWVVGEAICLASLITLPPVSAQTKPQVFEPPFSAERPLFELNLQDYGYKPPLHGRRGTESVAFATSDEIVLGWTTLDDLSDQKNGPLTPTPSHLHALVIDAHTGWKKSVRDWPASFFLARLSPAGKGRFLTCTGDAIRLLSHDFETIWEHPLPSSGPCSSMVVSPTGGSFALVTVVGKDFRHTLFDTDSFAPLAEWSKEARNEHFTDTQVIATCRPQSELCIRKLSQQWEPFNFVEVDQTMKDYKHKVPYFVNDSTIVISAAKEFAVVNLDGRLRFQLNVPKKFGAGTLVTSAGGDRFAIVETKMRGVTNQVLDMYAFPADDHLVVYSLQEQRAIYARKIKGTSPWSPWLEHRNRIALSPDGSALAVLDNGILAVYKLP